MCVPPPGSHQRLLLPCFSLPELIVFTQAVLEEGVGWSDSLTCARKDGERIELGLAALTLKLKGVVHTLASRLKKFEMESAARG